MSQPATRQPLPAPEPAPAAPAGAELSHNAAVGAALDHIADLLEVEGANPFRVRAYRNAARLVGDLTREVSRMVEAGEDLTELPGIGADLAGKIREIVATGSCAALREIEARTPPALTALLQIPGLGPRRVRALHEQLGVDSVEELAEAAREGRIRELHGFAEKTEQRILQALEARHEQAGRFRRADVEPWAEALAEHLRGAAGVRRVAIAGSYRRCKETVGDLDVVITGDGGCAALDRLVGYEGVAEIVSRGATRVTVVLRQGLQVDARLVDDASFGAAMHYFTGSKAHNIAVRRLGQGRGLKINEYGVFRGEQRVAGETEASVFASVGLPFIPPELREDRGEIAAARAGRLPRLIEAGELRGDLNVRALMEDGRSALREVALAAQARGYEYVAITDLAGQEGWPRRLSADGLLRQMEEIDALNEELAGITLLKGAVVDIRRDGSLDLPDAVLGRLDLVLGGIHADFSMTRAAQTARVLRAMDHRCFTILAHPTARLIGERPPVEIDMERVIRHAAERGCFLEINGRPERLDLLDVHAQAARDLGLLMAISSGARGAGELGQIRFGVEQARRGWLEREDALNTRPLAQLRGLLRRAR